MTHTTEQERAEFQEWALSKWPLMDVRTRSQDGNYADFETRTRFMAWQEAAARRAPVVPQRCDLCKNNGGYFYGRTGYEPCCVGSLAPRPPESPLVPSIAVTTEMVEAANEAYCPFGDMELALCAALQVALQPPEAAPVQLPEPVGWIDDGGIVFWNDGRKPNDGEIIYTEHQILAILSQNGIKTK